MGIYKLVFCSFFVPRSFAGGLLGGHNSWCWTCHSWWNHASKSPALSLPPGGSFGLLYAAVFAWFSPWTDPVQRHQPYLGASECQGGLLPCGPLDRDPEWYGQGRSTLQLQGWLQLPFILIILTLAVWITPLIPRLI